MQLAAAVAVAAVLPATALAETIVGAYVFHRHGDRTAKKTPPANLTNLGYTQVFQSGAAYHARYVAAASPQHVAGLAPDTASLAQLSVSAPADAVLQNSATGFLQALYPPAGAAGAQRLRNGTLVEAPRDGAQLIPVAVLASNGGSENNAWLQDATGCGNAILSSNAYYYSDEYKALLASTGAFYESLYPVVNRTFGMGDMSFKNAYTIFDLINVALIHNETIQSSTLLTPDTTAQLVSLAGAHEFGLAFNASSPIRGVAGMQLAAEITSSLAQAVNPPSKQKLGIQFGSYGTMMSLFGLLGLPGVDGDRFYGIPDYASSMAFELYSDSASTAAADLRVRFLWHNGSSDAGAELQVYPLFQTGQMNLTWADFQSRMAQVSVGTDEQWCHACGNVTGVCAQFAGGASGAGAASTAQGSAATGNGLSPAVNGVIGAMVALAAILLVQGAVVLLFGLRVVSRKRLAALAAPEAEVTKSG